LCCVKNTTQCPQPGLEPEPPLGLPDPGPHQVHYEATMPSVKRLQCIGDMKMFAECISKKLNRFVQCQKKKEIQGLVTFVQVSCNG